MVFAVSTAKGTEEPGTATATDFSGGSEYSPGEVDPETGDPIPQTAVDPETGAEFVAGEILVVDKDSMEIIKVKDNEGKPEKSARALKGKIETVKAEKAHTDEFDDGNIAVDLNYTVQAALTPNDPRYVDGDQYHLPQIGMPAAWNDQTVGAKVCIIGTGWSRGHDDLDGRVEAERSTVGDDPVSTVAGDNVNGHGTLTAGIVGAETDNNLHVAGVT